ncbi:MAG: carboxypeptidase regulatory-like domain-containing protein [Chitinophagaceae bacterium]|nr:MAG: carboxypeptidase regulatory-like domain-containing protein [Chitinophagaceae bacterium]
MMYSQNTLLRLNILSFTTCLLLCLGACKKSDAGETGSAKGYATGKITNADGAPIQGARVVANNSMIFDGSPSAVTDANGIYKIKLPAVGTFHTSAQITKSFNGQVYILELTPDSYDEFSIEGANRNFVWKLTGQRETASMGYYGATLAMNSDLYSLIEDYSKVTWTLVPQGKLIDGSQGATLTLKCGAPMTSDYAVLRDIPLGRYKVSAVYKENNLTRPLRIGYLDTPSSAWTPEFIMDFQPTLPGYAESQMVFTEN